MNKGAIYNDKDPRPQVSGLNVAGKIQKGKFSKKFFRSIIVSLCGGFFGLEIAEMDSS